MKKPLLVLVGPTASGKTELSVELALQLNGEVVSADSMLIYKGMNIGTAKPTLAERKNIPHHLIDIIEPWEEFSVAQYQPRAEQAIADIHQRNKLPILVGGTGLYVRAIIDNYNFDVPGGDQQLRQHLMQLKYQLGNQWLHRQLAKVDPVAAEKIHHNNVRRVIRALEVYQLTGRRFSDTNQVSYRTNAKYNTAMFGINYPKEVLDQRINKRVDAMLAAGLVDEVKHLIKHGLKRSSTAMQGLGYKEIAAYIDTETSLDDAVELLKRDTRRYAKRQFSWFKRDPRIHWIDGHKCSPSIFKDKIINSLQEKHFNMSKC